MLFANVCVDISLDKLDRPFGYIIPERLTGLVKEGDVVVVPFGNGGRTLKAFVIEITDHYDYPIEKMKEIIRLDNNSRPVTSRLIELADWMRRQYGSTMNQALKTVLPVKSKVRQIERKSIKLVYDEMSARDALENYKRKNSKAKFRLMKELLENNILSRDIVVNKLNISSSTLKSMEAEGAIEIVSDTDYRNPVKLLNQPAYDIVLNEQQRAIADDIGRAMTNIYEKKEDYRVHLIHGITGSGKTEIYIDLISKCIDSGRDAIVLIPEIALTYQTVKRFTRKFGQQVSIINSRLSKGERYDQFERASKGKIKIMIGPRSALFTPFCNLGLIIIDEEHENSYKSEQVPKYDAKNVAEHIAQTTNAVLVLGSATPSLDSYYKAKSDIYKLHRLTKRGRGELAQVSVVDMRSELKNGNRSMFSIELQKLIRDRLDKKEQIMLFINRRGYAGFVSCRECGTVMKCPHCDVSLKAHNNGTLVCHYCGYTEPTPRLCPKCGSKYIAGFGTGTQKVETMIKQTFKDARVLRMDLDTTSKKGGHEEILSAFANHDADILVGTQMIVKGHDFPKVTLVGVLAADMSLYASDYRAAERTFQLLTQASGRAGRGDSAGQVIIQTYSPDNYSIVYSKKQDYEQFYEEEIAYRKLMKYPPVAYMTAILLQSSLKNQLESATYKISEFIKTLKENNPAWNLFIIGPADASIARINDIYRKVIYLKNADNEKLIEIKDLLEDFIDSNPDLKNINIQFDFNPMGNY